MVMGVECMYVTLNVESLEEVDCFKYLGVASVAGGGY